jgi:hypothetical protein
MQPEYYDMDTDEDVYTFKTAYQSAMYFPKTSKTIELHDFLFIVDSLIYANNGGVVNENGLVSGGKFSLFDRNGNPLTTEDFDLISLFSQNHAFVSRDGKMGFIDNFGKIVVDLKYDYIMEGKFFEGLATVNIGGIQDPQQGFSGGKWGFINTKGEMVIPAEYDGALLFKSGLAAVKKGNLVGAIDITGKTVIPFEYQDIGMFENGIAYFVQDNMYGFIDKSGKKITSNIWQGAYNFSEGLAAVMKDNKIGFIDEAGNVVIPVQYDGGESFENGCARVVKGSTIFLLDKKGAVIKQSEMQ